MNSTADLSHTIQLSVARLTQRPLEPQVQKRVPRPDDPIPRKPPAFFLQELKRGNNGELKRVASSSGMIGVGSTKRQKLTNGIGIAADLGSGVRLGTANAEDDRLFKVPEVPRQTKGKEKEDVFGDVTKVSRVSCVKGKGGKGKQKSEEGSMANEVAYEKTNKNVSVSCHFANGEILMCSSFVSLSNEQR